MGKTPSSAMTQLSDWGDELELPRARRDDPWTSHAAGDSIPRERQLQTAFLVCGYYAVAGEKGLTGDELEILWAGERRVTSSPRSRKSELYLVGYLAKNGEWRLTRAGEWGEVYVITQTGLDWFKKGPKIFQAEFRRRLEAIKPKKPKPGLDIKIDYDEE